MMLRMRAVSLAFALGMGALVAWGADDPSPAQIDDIIQKFAAKEAEFQQARDNYTYTQTSRIQELDEGGAVTGRWEITADITYEIGRAHV